MQITPHSILVLALGRTKYEVALGGKVLRNFGVSAIKTAPKRYLGNQFIACYFYDKPIHFDH